MKKSKHIMKTASRCGMLTSLSSSPSSSKSSSSPVSIGADKAAALSERPRLSFLSLISWSFVSAAF